MKTELTADRLIHAINNQLEGYTAEDALAILQDEYRFTDDEIRAMGFDYLFDLVEPDEPEEPLEEFRFSYTETWTGVFTVSAHNREEAINLFEKQLDDGEIDMVEGLEKTDSDWYPLEF